MDTSLLLYQFGNYIIIGNKCFPVVKPPPSHNIKLIIKHVPSRIIHYSKQRCHCQTLPNPYLQWLCWLLLLLLLFMYNCFLFLHLHPLLRHLSQIIYLIFIVRIFAFWPFQYLPLERKNWVVSARMSCHNLKRSWFCPLLRCCRGCGFRWWSEAGVPFSGAGSASTAASSVAWESSWSKWWNRTWVTTFIILRLDWFIVRGRGE